MEKINSLAINASVDEALRAILDTLFIDLGSSKHWPTVESQIKIAVAQIKSAPLDLPSKIRATNRSRNIVLDIAEQTLGVRENWTFIRRRLLKIYGDQGLSKTLQDVFGDAEGRI